VLQVLLLCALLVICWLAQWANGYVAGCSWHIHIVYTKDAAKHDAQVVHGAIPRAPLVDVTDALKKLTITGIKIDNEVGDMTV